MPTQAHAPAPAPEPIPVAEAQAPGAWAHIAERGWVQVCPWGAAFWDAATGAAAAVTSHYRPCPAQLSAPQMDHTPQQMSWPPQQLPQQMSCPPQQLPQQMCWPPQQLLQLGYGYGYGPQCQQQLPTSEGQQGALPQQGVVSVPVPPQWQPVHWQQSDGFIPASTSTEGGYVWVPPSLPPSPPAVQMQTPVWKRAASNQLTLFAGICAAIASSQSTGPFSLSLASLAVAFAALAAVGMHPSLTREGVAVLWCTLLFVVPLIMNLIDFTISDQELASFVSMEPSIRNPARMTHAVAMVHLHGMADLSRSARIWLPLWCAVHFAARAAGIYIRLGEAACAMHVALNPVIFFHLGLIIRPSCRGIFLLLLLCSLFFLLEY